MAIEASAVRDSALQGGAFIVRQENPYPHRRLQQLTGTRYKKLETSGALQPLLRDPALSATRPFLEEDIRSTIDSLEASTAAIQKQSQVLSLQCEMIKKQLRSQKSLDEDKNRDIARLRKKHEAGKQNMTVLGNELSDELETAIKSETDKAGAENKRILSALSTRLKQDDKTLALLETVLSETESKGDDASTVKRAAHLSQLLADYSADEIHHRLDRLYLEAIQASTNASRDGTAGDETISVLEEELESLYPEIEVLAQISTKHQFHDPILREVHNEHSHLRASSQQKLEHVCCPLIYRRDNITLTSFGIKILDVLIDMTLSKQSLTTQLADWESACEVLVNITTLYQAETANRLVAQPSRRESLRRRSLQSGLMLGATRTPAPRPELPSLENLLRRIGVSPDSILQPRIEEGGAHGLYEKRMQMLETVRRLGTSAEAPIREHFNHSDQAAQLLESSLHGNSRYETSLRNPAQEEALLGLEAEIASLQKGVEGLDLIVLHQRDKAQAKFIERWG
ncbi:hypothetical protein N7488_007026 [Penicillium malachiteum]|nr:hypothetical protein N7488_007026 [Penicillium malachiteum]